MNERQQALIMDFTGTLDDLEAVLDGVPDEGLDWAENEDEWSIREIIHHLTDDYNVYTFIIERALATPDCKVFFGEFPGNETWADRLDFVQRPVSPALDVIRAKNAFLTELVGHFPNRWDNKVNYHDYSGENLASRTVTEMIHMLTEHMRTHISMIEKILETHSDSAPE